MNRIKTAFTLCLLASVAIISCGKQDPICDGSEPTYNNEIESIITSQCATGGCHPSYTTYSSIQGILNSGQFEVVVLKAQSMPKGGKLTQSEINSIQCWVDNGYPEK